MKAGTKLTVCKLELGIVVIRNSLCFEDFKGTETPLSAVTNAHVWIAFQVERHYRDIFNKTLVYDLVR